MKWLKFSVILQNDSFTHSFGKMTKSFMHFMKWLTCWIFCYTIWLFVSLSNRHIVKRGGYWRRILFLFRIYCRRWLWILKVISEKNFTKSMGSVQLPDTQGRILCDYFWDQKGKPRSQIKVQSWVLSACQVLKNTLFFAFCCYYYLSFHLLWICPLILLYFLPCS